MRYALLVCDDEKAVLSPEAREDRAAQFTAFQDEMEARGVLLGRERLRDIPHAHFHATDGATLPQFADESFDFIYSYAVFQHIPTQDVVLEFLHFPFP